MRLNNLLFILLLLFSGQILAASSSSCKAYYERDLVLDDKKPGSVKVIALEDRVPVALECLYVLRERLHSLEEQRDQQLTTPAVTADGDSQDNAGVEPQLKETRIQLSALEEDLRNIAKRLDKMVASRCACIEDRQLYEEQYNSIQRYFKIPQYERLYIDFNDYDRYFFKLNIGYEYTTVSTILEQSSPRLGLIIYHHYGRRPYHDEYGSGHYGIELAGDLVLSGATEQNPATPPAQPTEDNKTLGIDIFLFTPLLRTKIRPDLGLQTGPLLMVGAKQTDASKKINERAYVGVRSALSPMHQLDVLFGHSLGLKSVRMEIRGQMPVSKLGDSSSLFLGAVGNMGVLNDQPDEEDIITVYLSWNIDFTDLFATGG